MSAIVICAASYMGYMSYEKANMTAEELALLENVEALSVEEGFPGSALKGCCWSPGKYCEIVYNGVVWNNSNMKKC